MEEILELCKKNNGYVTNKNLKDNEIPTVYLSRLCNSGDIKKVGRGVYLLKDDVEDDYFIFSLLYPNLIFHKYTALYLNGLINDEPEILNAVIDYNKAVPKTDDVNIMRSRKSTINIGDSVVVTPSGNECRCYDMERCICDLFIYDDIKSEIKREAIQNYRKKHLNKEKLYDYGKKLGIYDKLSLVFDLF